ncbi:unnamed protein product [Rotaria sp. Silwood2]|nr:unnamed protein product [Rotaria sp. Silwood2]
MRFSKSESDNTTLLINEHETTTSPISSLSHKTHHSSIQCHTLREDHMPNSKDKSSPSSEYIYTEIVKAIGNNEFIQEKRLLKRASWSPGVHQEHGLPPTGKHTDSEQLTTHKNSNRVRIRPTVTRYFQPQQNSHYHQMSFGRPVSLNEGHDRHSIDPQSRKLSKSSLNHNNSFSQKRCESSTSLSSSSVDTIGQITERRSPSYDNSDFMSDTSTASSITTTNTLTSLCSTIPSHMSRRTSPNSERIHSSIKRPLLSEYQQQNLTPVDYKLSSPAITIRSTSPISLPSSISTSITSFAQPKGHEQSLSSSKGSSLNQYTEFTSQTLAADTSRNNIGPSTTITTRSIMTMSMSPNRHHNQTRSAKAIITSSQISPSTNVTIMTNNSDGLKQQQQRDQSELTTVCSNGCLKSPTNTNNNNRMKKSVHFDWHLPKEIRSRSPSSVNLDCNSNYQQTVAIASSSSLSNGNDLLKRQSPSVDKPMPLNSLLVKTSSLNTIINPQIPQQSSSSSTAKKLISNGFFNFIGRSNSSNNKSSTSTEENKQLRRTSSTQLRAQRKSKQQTTLTTGTNGNKRLSADVESLLPVSSINSNHNEISNEDEHIFDKVTTNNNINRERQSSISLVSTSIDNNINGTSSSNIGKYMNQGQRESLP